MKQFLFYISTHLVKEETFEIICSVIFTFFVIRRDSENCFCPYLIMSFSLQWVGILAFFIAELSPKPLFYIQVFLLIIIFKKSTFTATALPHQHCVCIMTTALDWNLWQGAFSNTSTKCLTFTFDTLDINLQLASWCLMLGKGML